MRFALPLIVAMAVCTFTTASMAPVLTQKYVRTIRIELAAQDPPEKPKRWRGEFP